jgi:hypothetical protein
MDSVLRVQLAEEDADEERLDTLTRFLLQELLQLDVESVTELPAGEPPPGSRGFDAAAVGGLLVGLGSAAQGLSAVIFAVRAWLARGGNAPRRVRLEIGGDALELSAATSADQDRLIGLFISRHATGESENGDRPA